MDCWATLTFLLKYIYGCDSFKLWLVPVFIYNRISIFKQMPFKLIKPFFVNKNNGIRGLAIYDKVV